MNDLNEREIDLMDEIFTHKFKNTSKYSDDWYKETYKLNHDEFDAIFKLICKYGEKEDLMSVKPYKTKVQIIVNFKKEKCDRFIDRGGFKQYFIDLGHKTQAEEKHLENQRSLTDKGNKLKIPAFVIATITLIILAYKTFSVDKKAEKKLNEETSKEQTTLITDSVTKLSNKKIDSLTISNQKELTSSKDSLKNSSSK